MRTKYTIILFSFFSIVLSSILVSGYLVRKYLIKSAKELTSNISVVENYISSDNWDEANAKMKSIENKWRSTKKYWSLFTNHHEIDNISESLYESSSYVKFNDKEMSDTSINSLKNYITHIPEMENVCLENII